MIIVMDNYCYKIHTFHFCSLPTNVDGDDIKSMAVIESEMAIKSGPKINRDSKSGERGEHALAIFLPLLC